MIARDAGEAGRTCNAANAAPLGASALNMAVIGSADARSSVHEYTHLQSRILFTKEFEWILHTH